MLACVQLPNIKSDFSVIIQPILGSIMHDTFIVFTLCTFFFYKHLYVLKTVTVPTTDLDLYHYLRTMQWAGPPNYQAC